MLPLDSSDGRVMLFFTGQGWAAVLICRAGRGRVGNIQNQHRCYDHNHCSVLERFKSVIFILPRDFDHFCRAGQVRKGVSRGGAFIPVRKRQKYVPDNYHNRHNRQWCPFFKPAGLHNSFHPTIRDGSIPDNCR